MARTAQVNGTALVGMMTVAMAMMVAASCAGADEMVTLEKASYGPYGAQALVVANSPGAWRQQMKALEVAGALAVLPAPEPPTDVDWGHEVVVLVAAGTTGYEVALSSSHLGNGRTCTAHHFSLRLSRRPRGGFPLTHLFDRYDGCWHFASILPHFPCRQGGRKLEQLFPRLRQESTVVCRDSS